MATQSETENRAAARSAEYFEKAVDHHAAGRMESAISAYRAALLGNPDGVDVLSNLGIALCETGHTDEGIAKMRHALRISPDDPDILNNLGNALLEAGQAAPAVETLIHAATISPNDADLRLLLSRAYLADGDVSQAADQLNAAIMIDPNVEDLDAARALIAPYRPDLAPAAPVNGNGAGHAPVAGEPVRAADSPHDASRNGGSRNGTAGGSALVESGEHADSPAPNGSSPHAAPFSTDFGVTAPASPVEAGASSEPPHAAPFSTNFGVAGPPQAPIDTEATGDEPSASHFGIDIDLAAAMGLASNPNAPRTGIGFHHPTTLRQLHGKNKVFSWVLFAVILAHLGMLVYLYLTGQLNNMLPPKLQIIHFIKQEKTVVKPVPKPPLGSLTQQPSHNQAQPHQHQQPTAHTHTVTISTNGPADMPDPDRNSSLDAPQMQDTLSHNDLPVASGDDQKGTGEPAGFADGKIGGKVYFIRLKHGSGAWNAYADGTKSLLEFANKLFPCESETRPMTAQEIRDNYLSKGWSPSFLYIYADDSFNLTGTEVTVLQNYLDSGGFLFIDARPDPAVKDAVAAQMARVLPGSGLMALSNGDSINRFLFRLGAPGIGENFIGVGGVRANYGVRGPSDKLQVFFTMGNFSHFYEQFPPNTDDYTLAQYQMGANVIAYAIEKGDSSKMSPRAGAKATITTSELQQLGFLGGGAPGAGPKPGESVKVKGSGSSSDPGEIKVLDGSD